MNKLTIQINNLEALERLIGGDTEVEIEIRNSVAQNFAEKHLKALANTNQIEAALQATKEEIVKQIKEKCEREIATFKMSTSWYNQVSEVKLHPGIHDEINRQVRNIVDEKVKTEVDEALKFWYNDAEITKRIEKRFEYYTNDFISTEIKKRLEQIKAKL